MPLCASIFYEMRGTQSQTSKSHFGCGQFPKRMIKSRYRSVMMDSICHHLHGILKSAITLVEIQSNADRYYDKILSKTKHDTMCKLMDIIIDTYSES